VRLRATARALVSVGSSFRIVHDRTEMEVVRIEAPGERAIFAPDAGCQCMGYCVGSVQIISGAADAETLIREPFASGIPVLFPWPGRVAGAAFSWKASRHSLPANEAHRGHALHGLVYNRPFRVTRRAPFYFRCELDSRSDAEISAIWRYPFRLELDYEIGGGLRLSATVHNVGREPMPFGFGAHPYFPVPLDSRSKRDATLIGLNASRRLALTDDLIPSGRDNPVAGAYDFRDPRELGAGTYDDVFRIDDGQNLRARLLDPSLRIAMEITADADFRYCVVYAPGNRAVVSIEPYTCAPDAFNLAARGIDSGAKELAPGTSWRGAIQIRISAP
jgi:aldose 1-epimerase